MTVLDWGRFAEKVALALESSLESHYERGTSGLEVEFNILDSRIEPVQRVGFGPESRSFADVFIEDRLPGWLRSRMQLEVFHWMVEAATRPYYSPLGAAWEAKAVEGALADLLAEAGLSYGERFFALHGNLPREIAPDEQSIPDGWSLAKKRYLARCVAMFGGRLATAGIHTNHSLPESLLAWDFFHRPLAERRAQSLEQFRSEAMIRATRVMRPYCALFIATSAASPLSAERVDGVSEVVLTAVDSNRLLTFPNPEALDVPFLYASHKDYLSISEGLVRRGVRFGSNNWTPVRARSDVDPVNRILGTTSEQLRELYRRGIYAAGEHASLEDAERALIVENLVALVDLPMTRVEVRTDEGGDDLDLAVAKVVFKELLLYRIYADPACGLEWTYDSADVARARGNEHRVAERGLDAEIEWPSGRGTVAAREWLGATLAELAPLARALGRHGLLAPLEEMAKGAPNPAGAMRAWFQRRLAGARRAPSGRAVVPPELLREWCDERRGRLAEEVASIVAGRRALGAELPKLTEVLEPLEELGRQNPSLPVRPAAPAPREHGLAIEIDGSRRSEVLALAAALVRIPSVTNCANERLEEVFRCARFIGATLSAAGLEVRLWDTERYPAVLAGFPAQLLAPVTLSGHFDVVEPEPGDIQFEPYVDGDYLWGRGAADMKTVVASDLVWMMRRAAAGPPYPQVNLLLVGNEENGESEPYGTPQVLHDLARDVHWSPELMALGERTGERGDELFGEVCVENRGVVRLRFVATGERAHTGFASRPTDLLALLVEARQRLGELLPRFLTLDGPGPWKSSAVFPFLAVGQTGVYNITPDEGALGLEVRPIPGDDVGALVEAGERLANELGLSLKRDVLEGGVRCPPGNPHLRALLTAVERASGRPARVGRKLAGTSARFAPEGNAVVWGQSGIGPHSRSERHFIPSIEPYLAVLDAWFDPD